MLFFAPIGSENQDLAGRPVLMVGTLASAFLKAASFMPVSACKPARINSLFLISIPRASARFLDSPICSNSLLGMVKLSRTTLTFLSFKDFAGLAAGFGTAVLVWTVAGAVAVVFAEVLAGELVFGVTLRTGLFGTVLEAALAGVLEGTLEAALRGAAFLAGAARFVLAGVLVFMVMTLKN